MTVEKKLSAPQRRTRAEVQQWVAEFMSGSMRRSEFCRSRGLSFGTLNRHLKNAGRVTSRTPSAPGQLVAVELGANKSGTEQGSTCPLVVVSGGRRIEVHHDFGAHTFGRLVSLMERM
jgi:hypothetical protein